MKLVKRVMAAVAFILCLGIVESEVKASQLSKGSVGQEVVYVQSVLKKLGYFHLEPTGYYGPITTEAVKQFQKDFNIDMVGVVGPETTNMLYHVTLMAQIVHGEARGESYEGQVAVAAVILNRVESSEFPNTISNVIFQKNAFTAVNDGQYMLEPDTSAYRAVKDAFLGWDPTYGSLYYYNPTLVTDHWIFTRQVTNQIGKHHFAY
ncbi:cell wall hydrolase [Rossellomorea sp. BNER]|uniref:cell wall hydrolase n=1 Tax=Rossellomorea sp. BNER TaxID=2962031 RepID=UPI003AF278E7|nr:cell wall hydrolase [Rossellomorea sp. BNER]